MDFSFGFNSITQDIVEYLDQVIELKPKEKGAKSEVFSFNDRLLIDVSEL
jgi:hypothetical protein